MCQPCPAIGGRRATATRRRGERCVSARSGGGRRHPPGTGPTDTSGVGLRALSSWQPGRVTAGPLVVAHRGASDQEPEHTLAAYVEAIKVGADALECDVRLTADGHLVCVHDRDVRRTSNGRGLVSTLELTDLEGLDWGSWKAPEAGRPGDGGSEEPDVVFRDDRAHLLTLKKLLGLVADTDRRVEVAVETKHPTRYGGLVERALVD